MAIDNDGWQTVAPRRKQRRAPEYTTTSPPLLTRSLVPYGSRPSYASALSANLSLPSDQRAENSQHRRRQPSAPASNHRAISSPNPGSSNPSLAPTKPNLNSSVRQTRPREIRTNSYTPRPPRQPKFITSPDSPTTLKFPPTNLDPDWRNRCFRCFRQGHSAAQCANPRRCATCWGQGHDYFECPGPNSQYRGPPTARLPAQLPRPNPPPARGGAQPVRSARAPTVRQPPPNQQNRVRVTAPSPASLSIVSSVEPDFQDLLEAPTAATCTLPPKSERPNKISCNLVRDEAFSQEVARLSRGLVISLPSNSELDVSIDEIAKQVAATGLVTPQQLQVAPIYGGKFLVLPPVEVSATDICLAFPEAWWTRGFSACLWSPWIGAEVNIPRYKVWLQLINVPEQCWREDFVAQAVGEFGTYLGTIVSNELIGCWEVAVAVHDLRNIPVTVGMTAGAFDYMVPVEIRKWIQKQVFSIEDFPQPPAVIVPPSQRSYSAPVEPALAQIEESVNIKIKDLKQIFRNGDLSQVPADIVAALRLPEQTRDKGKKVAADVTFSRSDLSVQKNSSGMGGPSSSKQILATRLTPQNSSLANPLKRLSNIDVMELQASVRGGSTKEAEKRMLTEDDFAAQVLFPSYNSVTIGSGGENTTLLFPELVPTIPPTCDTAGGSDGTSHIEPESTYIRMSKGSKKGSTKKSSFNLKPHLARACKKKTASIKKTSSKRRKSGPQIAVVNPSEFYDVPLTYVETADIATLVGLEVGDLLAQNSDVLQIENVAPIDSRINSRPADNSEIHQVSSPIRGGIFKGVSASNDLGPPDNTSERLNFDASSEDD